MTRPAGQAPICPYGYRLAKCLSCGHRRLIDGDDDTPECPKCHDGEQECSEKAYYPLPPSFFTGRTP